MHKLITNARLAYCIGLAGMVFPQFFFGEFGSNFFPKWPGLPWVAVWADLFSAIVIVACTMIVLEKKRQNGISSFG